MNTLARSVAVLAVALGVLCPSLALPAATARPLVAIATGNETCQKAQDVARVRAVRRGLYVERHGRREKVRQRTMLIAGDVVATHAGERGALTLCDGSTLYLNAKSAVELRTRRITDVRHGEIAERVKNAATQQLDSSAARGTTHGGTVDVRVEGKATRFAVSRGSVVVQNARGEVRVTANQQTVVLPDKAPQRPTQVDAGRSLSWTASAVNPVWTVFATFDPSYFPYRVDVNARGDVYVANLPSEFQSIVELSPGGKKITSWGLRASGGQIAGLALDAQSNVYVSDATHSTIEKFTPDGRYLTTIGPIAHGTAPDLEGVEVDSSGNLYVAESRSNQVRKLSATGQELLVVGGTGSVLGRLDGPTDVALDRAGNIYVSERVNGRIQKFSPAGQAIRTFGTGDLEFPTDVALDAAGNIYVSEPPRQRIHELSPGGRTLKLWTSQGTSIGYLDDPNGVALDAAGNMYVTDYHKHRIAKLVRQ